eukprot:363634-Chlamydomonas_euryale.AAC.24
MSGSTRENEWQIREQQMLQIGASSGVRFSKTAAKHGCRNISRVCQYGVQRVQQKLHACMHACMYSSSSCMC